MSDVDKERNREMGALFFGAMGVLFAILFIAITIGQMTNAFGFNPLRLLLLLIPPSIICFLCYKSYKHGMAGTPKFSGYAILTVLAGLALLILMALISIGFNPA